MSPRGLGIPSGLDRADQEFTTHFYLIYLLFSKQVWQRYEILVCRKLVNILRYDNLAALVIRTYNEHKNNDRPDHDNKTDRFTTWRNVVSQFKIPLGLIFIASMFWSLLYHLNCALFDSNTFICLFFILRYQKWRCLLRLGITVLPISFHYKIVILFLNFIDTWLFYCLK